jgi:hypothetical protein
MSAGVPFLWAISSSTALPKSLSGPIRSRQDRRRIFSRIASAVVAIHIGTPLIGVAVQEPASWHHNSSRHPTLVLTPDFGTPEFSLDVADEVAEQFGFLHLLGGF